jgi:hypothetical protein
MQVQDHVQKIILKLQKSNAMNTKSFNFINKTNNSIIIILSTIFMLFYLFWNTGIHADDYSVINEMRGLSVFEFLNINRNNTQMMGLSSYFIFWWAYPFVNVNSYWIYDVVKFMAHLLSIWLIYKFSLDYLTKDRAFLLAILFVLNPMHEVTEYWYMTLPYILSPALIMYSHNSVRHKYYTKSLIFGVIGCFMGYMSPPYVFGLSISFFIEKKYKQMLIFLIPGFAYIIYYFSIAILYPSAEHRIQYKITFGTWLNNCFIQLISFIDSSFGPSFFFKIFFAINSIELVSLCLAFLVCLLIIIYFRSSSAPIHSSLLGGLISVLILSFGMLSLADIYGNRNFNLGNRLSVYGSLLITYLIMTISLNKKLILIISFTFILPIFGLSDHWKYWNAHQIKIKQNIKYNTELTKLNENDVLFISGNMYSRLGQFSHIDFFSMPWLGKSILQNTVKTKIIIPLNSYIYLDGNRIVDQKSTFSIEIDKDFFVYDSESNRLLKFSAEKLPYIMDRRPVEIRSWIQFFEGTAVESLIIYMNPRFSYIFR